MPQTPDSPWIRGIDGAAILEGRFDAGLADCIELHALMQGIADYIDTLFSDTSLEEILEALKDQIELAEDIENGCVADPVEEWRKDYYTSLGVDTSQTS